MIVGVPKEIKDQELRVGLLPSSIREVVDAGHTVLVETKAGQGSGASDEEYKEAGATIKSTAEEIFSQAELIIKVKEPQEKERKLLRKDQILFSYLHLAPDRDQTESLIASKAICIAYETVLGEDRSSTPLLIPMSQIAGRLSAQVGARLLESVSGGPGILMGSVPGIERAKIAIIGGGHVGSQAAEVAIGMGARVAVLDRSLTVLENLNARYLNAIDVIYANSHNIAKVIGDADMVIGAIHTRGEKAKRLVTREMLKNMRPGSVVVDVAIDQGGCFETSRATSHSNPTYVDSGILHYCVTNMPGSVPVSSSHALNNATLPYVLNLANKGYKKALTDSKGLLEGLNVCRGSVTNLAVAQSQSRDYVPALDAVSA